MGHEQGFSISEHAQKEMLRRSISPEQVVEILMHPGQIVPALGSRVAYQSLVRWPGGKMYVVRVVVEARMVLTVYRTSKIAKYWGNQP